MDNFLNLVCPIFLALFALYVWMAQLEYGIFLSVAESILFIFEQGKFVYIPFRLGGDHGDLQKRQQLYENFVLKFQDELNRAIIKLKLIPSTDKIRTIIKDYEGWEKDFEINLIMAGLSVDAKEKTEAWHYLWGTKDGTEIINTLLEKMEVELSKHTQRPYWGYICRHKSILLWFFIVMVLFFFIIQYLMNCNI